MAPTKQGIDQEIDRLFELPPEEFTAARDDLAKRLKAEGPTEEAAEVKALRRPTVAAWAVNQAARQHPQDVEELLAAGAELRAVQRKVLSGVRAEGFREAMDRRRRAVTKLSRVAEQVLMGSGQASPGATQAVNTTFEAASLDEEAAEAVRAGRLSKELAAPSSFGGVEGLEVVRGASATSGPAGHRKEDEETDAARAAAEREREAKQLANDAAQARRRAIKARDQADRARSKVTALEQQAAEAKVVAREAERAARDAESDAKRADAAAARAAT